jgi:uncharacterized membrane protein YfcA
VILSRNTYVQASGTEEFFYKKDWPQMVLFALGGIVCLGLGIHFVAGRQDSESLARANHFAYGTLDSGSLAFDHHIDGESLHLSLGIVLIIVAIVTAVSSGIQLKSCFAESHICRVPGAQCYDNIFLRFSPIFGGKMAFY